MKLSRVWVGCALLACAGVAQATVIPVVNGDFSTVVTPYWSALPTGGAWVFDIGTDDYINGYSVLDANGEGHFNKIATNGAILVTDNAISTSLSTPKSIYQDLTYNVVAGDVFTLGFDMGTPTSGGGDGSLLAQIWVGGTVIASNSNFHPVAEKGFWEHATLTGTATSTGTLKILFGAGSVAGTPWLDTVTMTVPEPASLGLLSLAGLALLRRRK